MGRRFYRLANDCHLVEGTHDAVIYDVPRRRMVLLDEPAHRFLRRCEANCPTGEEDGDAGHERRVGEILEREGLVQGDDAPAYVERFLPHAPIRAVSRTLDASRIRKVAWTITRRCEHACGFCPRGNDGASYQACMTCLRDPASATEAPLLDDVAAAVARIAALGAATLHVRGGNPLLEWNRLAGIVKEAEQHPGLSVMITTPGTGRPVEDLIALCTDRRVMLNVVLFSPHHAVGGGTAHGRHVRSVQRELIRELRRENLPVAITVVLRAPSDAGRARVRRAVQAIGPRLMALAEVLDASQLQAGCRLCRDPDAGKPLRPWANVEEFHARLGYSLCLAGQCEIRPDGTVHPCAGIDACCGRADGMDIHAALAGDQLYEHWWRLSKDACEPCSRCAMRYACVDCPAAVLGADGNAPDVQRICRFDPGDARRAADASWSHSGFVYRLTPDGLFPVTQR